jgi:hypothetical protein
VCDNRHIAELFQYQTSLRGAGFDRAIPSQAWLIDADLTEASLVKASLLGTQMWHGAHVRDRVVPDFWLADSFLMRRCSFHAVQDVGVRPRAG